MWEVSGVCFRPTGGVSGIHMIEDYFGLGGDIGLKLCRMKGSVWGYQCVRHVCTSVWVSVHKLWVKGTSGWALFYWQCHNFTNTGVLFLFKGGHWGITNKYGKLYNALKCVNCIFIVFLTVIVFNWFIHISWPFSDNLIVYFCLFVLVLF